MDKKYVVKLYDENGNYIDSATWDEVKKLIESEVVPFVHKVFIVGVVVGFVVEISISFILQKGF